MNPKNFERLITRRGEEDSSYLQLKESIINKLSTRLNSGKSLGWVEGVGGTGWGMGWGYVK